MRHHLYTNMLIGQGVRAVDRIARAETYERRHEVVGAGNGPPGAAIFPSGFLNHSTSNYQLKFYQDADLGPEKFWRWSRQELFRPQSLVQWATPGGLEYKPTRDCGCVFWDEERLDNTGLLARRWRDVAMFNADYRLFRRTKLRSVMDRSALYHMGIRGYYGWSEDRVDRNLPRSVRPHFPAVRCVLGGIKTTAIKVGKVLGG
jgi:hypothetical protein